MHELSIVLGIVKIAETETKKANATRVERIELEIGSQAGIEFDALDFVWPSAVEGTVLESAKREITVIEAIGKCLDCDTEFKLLNIYDPCPQCKSYVKGVLSGKELRIKALEVA